MEQNDWEKELDLKYSHPFAITGGGHFDQYYQLKFFIRDLIRREKLALLEKVKIQPNELHPSMNFYEIIQHTHKKIEIEISRLSQEQKGGADRKEDGEDNS